MRESLMRTGMQHGGGREAARVVGGEATSGSLTAMWTWMRVVGGCVEVLS